MPMELILECKTFVRRDVLPSPRAADGANDDRVMTLCLALELYRLYGHHEHDARKALKRRAAEADARSTSGGERPEEGVRSGQTPSRGDSDDGSEHASAAREGMGARHRCRRTWPQVLAAWAAPPGPPGGGGLPPELMAALGGGEGALAGAPMGGNSLDLLGEGPMAGEETALADESAGEEDPLALVREAISLLRRAGDIEPDDQRSHLIDKIQADAQKILAGESQKTDKLRAALGG